MVSHSARPPAKRVGASTNKRGVSADPKRNIHIEVKEAASLPTEQSFAAEKSTRTGSGVHHKPDSKNVIVGVRCRDFRPKEDGDADVVVDMDPATGNCSVVAPGKGTQTYTFDKCFPPDSTQQDVFDSLGVPLIHNALNGFNSSLLAYGATGSGKTHSMFNMREHPTEVGGDHADQNPNSPVDSTTGLVPRILAAILEEGSQATAGDEGRLQTDLYLDIIEVYLEDVFDLLHDRVKIRIRGDNREGFRCDGLKPTPVRDYAHASKLIEEAHKARSVAATAVNDYSSRAHTIVSAEVRTKHGDSIRSARLIFADLAGCERIRVAKTEEGRALDEARNINLSLMALGSCVEAAVRNYSIGAPDRNIPSFRDSTLTKLLKECIGGNSRTSLLVTVAPGTEHLNSTTLSLRFGNRAKDLHGNEASNNFNDAGNLDPSRVETKEQRKEVMKIVAMQEAQHMRFRNRLQLLQKEESKARYNMAKEVKAELLKLQRIETHELLALRLQLAVAAGGGYDGGKALKLPQLARRFLARANPSDVAAKRAEHTRREKAAAAKKAEEEAAAAAQKAEEEAAAKKAEEEAAAKKAEKEAAAAKRAEHFSRRAVYPKKTEAKAKEEAEAKKAKEEAAAKKVEKEADTAKKAAHPKFRRPSLQKYTRPQVAVKLPQIPQARKPEVKKPTKPTKPKSPKWAKKGKVRGPSHPREEEAPQTPTLEQKIGKLGMKEKLLRNQSTRKESTDRQAILSMEAKAKQYLIKMSDPLSPNDGYLGSPHSPGFAGFTGKTPKTKALAGSASPKSGGGMSPRVNTLSAKKASPKNEPSLKSPLVPVMKPEPPKNKKTNAVNRKQPAPKARPDTPEKEGGSWIPQAGVDDAADGAKQEPTPKKEATPPPPEEEMEEELYEDDCEPVTSTEELLEKRPASSSSYRSVASSRRSSVLDSREAQSPPDSRRSSPRSVDSRSIDSRRSSRSRSPVDSRRSSSVDSRRSVDSRDPPPPVHRTPARSPQDYEKCAHCNEALRSGHVEFALECEDEDEIPDEAKLHEACIQGYKEKHSPKCAHCDMPMVDEYVQMKSPTGAVSKLHEACVPAYQATLVRKTPTPPTAPSPAKSPSIKSPSIDSREAPSQRSLPDSRRSSPRSVDSRSTTPDSRRSSRSRSPVDSRRSSVDSRRSVNSRDPPPPVHRTTQDYEKCAHCNEALDSDHVEFALECEDEDEIPDQVKVHEACMQAYKEKHSPKCAHCDKPMVDDYVQVTSPTGAVLNLHEACVPAYQATLVRKTPTPPTAPSPAKSPSSKSIEVVELSQEAKAATKIQAVARGRQARRRNMKALKILRRMKGNTTSTVRGEHPENKAMEKGKTTTRDQEASVDICKVYEKCAHCHKDIVDHVVKYSSDALAKRLDGPVKLHQDCVKAFEAAHAKPCHHCSKPMVDGAVTLGTSDGKEVELHEDCVGPYQETIRPKCANCNKQIMEEGGVQTYNGEPYHEQCFVEHLLKESLADTKTGVTERAQTSSTVSVTGGINIMNQKHPLSVVEIGQVIAKIHAIESNRSSIKTIQQSGNFSASDAEDTAKLGGVISDLKKNIIRLCQGSDLLSGNDEPEKKPEGEQGEVLAVDLDIAKEELLQFIERLTNESDADPVNINLMTALLDPKIGLVHPNGDCAPTIPLDGFPISLKTDLFESRGVLTTCANDASTEYLRIFLSAYTLDRLDNAVAMELFPSCIFNCQNRVALMYTLLREDSGFAHLFDFDALINQEDLPSTWLPFIEDVASHKKAIPREHRSDRLPLLKILFMDNKRRFGDMDIQLNEPGSDGQTFFSRAAGEGDVELLKLLIKYSAECVSDAKQQLNINRVQEGKTTALIQAAFHNQTESVKFLVDLPGIDLEFASDEGTALGLATMLNRDPALVEALKKAAAAK